MSVSNTIRKKGYTKEKGEEKEKGNSAKTNHLERSELKLFAP